MMYFLLLIVFIIIYCISFLLLDKYCRNKYSTQEIEETIIQEEQTIQRECDDANDGKFAYIKIIYDDNHDINSNINSLADLCLNINNIAQYKNKKEGSSTTENIIVHKKDIEFQKLNCLI